MTNIKVGIIRNELPNSAEDWITACRNRNIDYQAINFNMLEKLLEEKC